MIFHAVHNYGWKRDLPDFRDFKYDHDSGLLRLNNTLAPTCDLTNLFPEPYDQGDLGSCTANAGVGSVQYFQKKQGNTVFMPSRLFVYYYERVLENTVNSDSGASIRDSMKILAGMGAPPESMWPYVESQFTVQPPAAAVVAAKKDMVHTYVSVLQNLQALKTCLSEGYPINFGFTVYSSFESNQVASTGVVPMPHASEEVLGGHAVVICGYYDNGHVPAQGNLTDPSGGFFLVRNSWGPGWGRKGYFLMPYGYVCNSMLADDFWSIRVLNDTM